MAGREMTAWIAGLSFVSANLGSLELMGWAGSAYQYGILATHWYWIGAIPAMLFLGIIMMPFYYISKINSVPGYLHLRYGDAARALSGDQLRVHDGADERHQHVLDGAGDESGAGLEPEFQHLGLIDHGGSLCSTRRTALGHLQRGAAVHTYLAWRAAGADPGLIEVGGWTNLKHQIATNLGRTTMCICGARWALQPNPMGVHWTGIVFGLGFVISFGYWTTDFLVVQRVLSARQHALGAHGSHHRRRLQDGGAIHRDSARLACALVLPFHLVGESQAVATGHAQLQRGVAADAGALLRARTAGPGRHGADRGLHVGHGRQRQRIFDSLDL